MNNFIEASRQKPPIGVDIQISYISPIDNMNYMGFGRYMGDDNWNLRGEILNTSNIISWQIAAVFYNG